MKIIKCCPLAYAQREILDGLDRVDENSDSNSLRNQTVGFLQAVGYLKGEFKISVSLNGSYNYAMSGILLLT